MSLIVQKFGGSSVANAERVFNVADIVTSKYKEGNDLVVVVSAQGDTTDDLIANPDLAIAAFTALKQERERTRQLSETIAVQNQQIAEMQPKVSYYDIVLQCRDVLPIRVIAKDYGWSANKMNKYLHEKGIQFKQGNKVWLLYQKYANKGYTSTKTHVFEGSNGENHTSVHTYWTQAGRLFIYSLMKADGYLPLIEQEV